MQPAEDRAHAPEQSPLMAALELASCVTEADRQRQQAFWQIVRAAWSWSDMSLAPQSAKDSKATAEHDLRTALTVIRTTAEMMRDGPDLNAADRKTFARMLLAEEARLERVLLRPDQRAPD
ncbi:MAG: histidine kinase dimerization/phospho-acceptor domain-containing protein [Pseudomonadota bacterium]